MPSSVSVCRVGGLVLAPFGLVFERELVIARERSAPAWIVVFSESVPDELFVTEYAPEVGVIAKPYAEHVKGLSLPPVGRLPDRRYGIDFRGPFRYGHLQTEAVAVVYRIEVIDHIEPLLVLLPDVAEIIDPRYRA